MAFDEAPSLAQILLALLLFTVGIPALIVETRVAEPLRHLLHKRLRQKPMVELCAFTIAMIAGLIAFSGARIPNISELLLKLVVMDLVLAFAAAWVAIYKNVDIGLVVANIADEISLQFRHENHLNDPSVTDLITFGENLKGNEKEAVIKAIGRLCREVQCSAEYDGQQLEELLRGLQRIVEHNSSMEHHRRALSVVTASWQGLSERQHGYQDAKVLKEVAWALGSLAVSRQWGAIARRWMSAIPHVADVSYKMGIAAIHAKDYAVAIEALVQLSYIAEEEKTLPKEFIAVVAYFHRAGASAGRTAREFIDKLNYEPKDVRMAAQNASAEFRELCDYATADEISAFLLNYS